MFFKKKYSKENYKTPSSEINEKNLFFFSKILKDLEYFVSFGTLLGIVRDNNLIEGDDDIDFYVNIKDREKLINLLTQNNVKIDFELKINKGKYFLQIKRLINNDVTIADFYFYESDIEINHIIERWNFDGRTQDESTYLRIPKIFIYPIKKIKFKNNELTIPAEPKLLCELLYGKSWQEKKQKDKDYSIKVINGKATQFKNKKFLFFNYKVLTN